MGDFFRLYFHIHNTKLWMAGGPLEKAIPKLTQLAIGIHVVVLEATIYQHGITAL
jgi:hypothetical protein